MTVYPVELAFSNSHPRIVIKVKTSDDNDERPQIPARADYIETRTLTEKEKECLIKGMF